MFIRLLISAVFSCLLFITTAFANEVPVWGQAYSPNIGWINMYCQNGHTTPFQENDVISQFCDENVSYGVAYDSETKKINGYGYSPNAGWFDMTGITINDDNTLSGTVHNVTNAENFGTAYFTAGQPSIYNPGVHYNVMSKSLCGYSYSDKIGYLSFCRDDTAFAFGGQDYGVHFSRDSEAPTAILADFARNYVNEIIGLEAISFPAITRFNDFAVSVSDNEGIHSVQAHIYYYDGTDEVMSPSVLEVDGTTTAFVSGTQSANILLTVNKPGNALVELSLLDINGNTKTVFYTLDTDLTPVLHLDTIGWVDFRSQSLTITPQDFMISLPSKDVRYKKIGENYYLIATGARISPEFRYQLLDSEGTRVKEYNIYGDGVLTLNTDLEGIPDGEYSLKVVYHDEFLPASPEATTLVLVDNTPAPALNIGLGVPLTGAAAVESEGASNCSSSDIENATKKNGNIYVGCKPVLKADGFSIIGRHDVYVLGLKQLASSTEASIPEELQAMNIVVAGDGATSQTLDESMILHTDAVIRYSGNNVQEKLVTATYENWLAKISKIYETSIVPKYVSAGTLSAVLNAHTTIEQELENIPTFENRSDLKLTSTKFSLDDNGQPRIFIQGGHTPMNISGNSWNQLREGYFLPLKNRTQTSNLTVSAQAERMHSWNAKTNIPESLRIEWQDAYAVDIEAENNMKRDSDNNHF